jgi:multisubunit Na+/H+ antiporter MnhG subunit
MLWPDYNLMDWWLHFSVTIIVVGAAIFLIWLATIVDIVGSEFKNSADKIIWFIFVMLLAPVGIVLYFFIGRHQKSEEFKKSRRFTRYRDIGRE